MLERLNTIIDEAKERMEKKNIGIHQKNYTKLLDFRNALQNVDVRTKSLIGILLQLVKTEENAENKTEKMSVTLGRQRTNYFLVYIDSRVTQPYVKFDIISNKGKIEPIIEIMDEGRNAYDNKGVCRINLAQINSITIKKREIRDKTIYNIGFHYDPAKMDYQIELRLAA